MTAFCTQADFAHALLVPDLALSGLRTPNNSDPMVRFGVYRNNRIMSWRQALRDQFPVCCALVGDEFFTGLSDLYMATYPPDSPLMFEFGRHMGDFIADFAPARAAVPWLADMARLEYQRVQLGHARDPVPMSPEILAGWLHQPEKLAESRLILAPPLWLYESDYALYDIWAAHQEPNPDWAAIQPRTAQGVMIWRDGWRVVTEPVTRAQIYGIRRLQGPDLLGDILADDGCDWQDLLAFLLTRHLIDDITTGDI